MPSVSPTKPKTIILTFPGKPAYSLSPNSRQHWRVRHHESQEAKRLVRLIWLDRQQGDDPIAPIHGPVVLQWGIHLARGRKFMDRTNATATLKPFEDGLVACGIIDGDTPDIVTRIDIDQFLYRVDHPIVEGEIDVVITEAQP